MFLFVALDAYAEGDRWYIHTREHATADLFYVCSTETSDWINEQGDTLHFSDMTRPEHRAALYGEMRGVDSLVCPDNCHFYAPYYDQMTLPLSGDPALLSFAEDQYRLTPPAEIVFSFSDAFPMHYREIFDYAKTLTRE